jgi:hypothetical protein
MSTNQKAGYMIGLKTAMLTFQRKLNEKIFFSVKITEGNGSNHYVIKFVNCSRSVIFSGFSVSSTNITDCNDMTEKLLKVVLNTIKFRFSQVNLLIFSYGPMLKLSCSGSHLGFQINKTLHKIYKGLF